MSIFGVRSIALKSVAVLTLALGVVQLGKGQNRTSLDASQIYKNVSPAVVLIEMYDEKGKVFKTGSGFLISSDGKILTNYHVIAHSKQATVRLANGDAYDTVDVLDIDKRKDIALVRIRAVDVPFIKLGKSSAVEVGQTVYCLGNPLDYENTLSNGLVSAIRQDDGYRLFQISAPISNGSSGGPVLNTAGEVIAIASLIDKRGQNLNFAVPIDYASGMLSSTQVVSLANIYESQPAAPDKPASDPANDLWKLVNTDSKGGKIFYAPTRTIHDGDLTRAWFNIIMGGDEGALARVLDMEEVNCGTRSLRSIRRVFYNKDGTVVESDKPEDAYSEPAPGTNADMMLLAICGNRTTAPAERRTAEAAPKAGDINLLYGLGLMLKEQIHAWTEADARKKFGDSTGHRIEYSKDNKSAIDSDVYYYSDPTQSVRTITLVFDGSSGKLREAYLYPWSLTWDKLRTVIADDFKTTNGKDGVHLYRYTKKGINVLVDREGKVVSISYH
jgi:S1-C subfamily serine protease